MGDQSAIEWTEATWNPWQGCHKVSPGCKHCYMYREKKRYGQDPAVVVRSKPHTFNLPHRLKGRQRVFTCSWSDFFIEEADGWRDEAWEIIRSTPQLTYQILTKRPERMAGRLPWHRRLEHTAGVSFITADPWPNVWLGVSVEDQATADERIPLLLQTPAAVRWVSYEPALGPVDFDGDPYSGPGWLRGWHTEPEHWRGCDGSCSARRCPEPVQVENAHRLNWLVCGGESGPGARPFDLSWARQTIAQGRAASVPVFCKQVGAVVTGSWNDDATQPHGLGVAETIVYDGIQRVRWSLKDRKGGDPSEWPNDIRVREYPV